MKYCLLTLLGSLLMVVPVEAAPQSLHFDQLTNSEKQDPVEQQTVWVSSPACTLQCPYPDDHSQWVINPTACWWDVDDHRLLNATDNYLNAGASVVVTDCQVAETDDIYSTKYGTTAWWSNAPRPMGVQIQAPSNGLTVSVCYQPQARCFSLVPVYNSGLRSYQYNACIAVSYVDSTMLPAVAGSQGGTGIITTRTITVTNPTNKQVRSISGQIAQVGWATTDAGCAYSGTGYPHNEYPFRWSTP